MPVKNRELSAEMIEKLTPIWGEADHALRVDSLPHLVVLARLHHGEPVDRITPDEFERRLDKRAESQRQYRQLQRASARFHQA